MGGLAWSLGSSGTHRRHGFRWRQDRSSLSEHGAEFLQSQGRRGCRYEKAGLVAYNDWMRDYCAAAPKRLVGLGLLSALDVDWSLEEMKRCARLGLKGGVLPSQLPDGVSYADPSFDPLWTAAEDMDFPLHFHINIVQGRDRMAARLKVITKLSTRPQRGASGHTRAFESSD